MSNITQKHLVKATGIIGGAQFVSIVIGIVRTKIIAILLGPAGIGITGMLQSIIDLVRNATGFGLNYSAVKDIAQANVSKDDTKINTIITVLQNLVLWTGLLGMVLTIVFAKSLSSFTFGTSEYTMSVVYLSITLLLTSISGGQIALLQGKREIKLMAKATMFGALYSAMSSIVVYYFYGVKGIVPSLILTSIITLLFSWYYARKIKYKRQKISVKHTILDGLGMAKLGFFIVITGFMATLTLYMIRVFISSKLNIDSVGYFQASWMISNMYIGIILNAMLSDFFPRLSAINFDEEASNELINHQLEIALVLGAPMILGLMALASLVINVLYSSSFFSAIPILQWQLFGSFITLILWPLGVLFLAKNRGEFCIITDGIWSILYLGIIYFGWDYFGFSILGIGYFLALFVKLFIVYYSTHKIGNFTFSTLNLKYIIFFGLLSSFMMLNVSYFESYLQYFISFSIILVAAIVSFSKLNALFNLNKLLKLNSKNE